MSVQAMKQALEALDNAIEIMPRAGYTAGMQRQAAEALRQAIAEAEKREWVGLDDDIPGLGLVTEEFYNGMLCAEDILRKKNT